MNKTTERLFESHEIRKTKKQKSAFIDFVSAGAEELGYECRVEKGSLGSRNVVVGKIDSANVVYTAHYDTCPRLPFPNFITPKNMLVYVLYQFALVGVIFLAATLVELLVCAVLALFIESDAALTAITGISGYLTVIGALLLMLLGPANKHTANDNTSGVSLLLRVMEELPEELRGTVAFVFFDLEEVGLIGSSSFASKHKAEMKNKLLLNFDCVSDGENILFALKRGAAPYKGAISEAFAERDGYKVQVLDKGVFYPSDQAAFPLGVGVCALKSTRGGLLYMNRIHTGRDTVYNEENVDFLTNGAIKLLEIVNNNKSK